MAMESVVRWPQSCTRPTLVEGPGSGFASVGAVARALGYTAKEQELAREILERFRWHRVPRLEDTDLADEERQPSQADLAPRSDSH